MTHFNKENRALCGWAGGDGYTITRYIGQVDCHRCRQMLGRPVPPKPVVHVNPFFTAPKVTEAEGA